MTSSFAGATARPAAPPGQLAVTSTGDILFEQEQKLRILRGAGLVPLSRVSALQPRDVTASLSAAFGRLLASARGADVLLRVTLPPLPGQPAQPALLAQPPQQQAQQPLLVQQLPDATVSVTGQEQLLLVTQQDVVLSPEQQRFLLTPQQQQLLMQHRQGQPPLDPQATAAAVAAAAAATWQWQQQQQQQWRRRQHLVKSVGGRLSVENIKMCIDAASCQAS